MLSLKTQLNNLNEKSLSNIQHFNEVKSAKISMEDFFFVKLWKSQMTPDLFIFSIISQKLSNIQKPSKSQISKNLSRTIFCLILKSQMTPKCPLLILSFHKNTQEFYFNQVDPKTCPFKRNLSRYRFLLISCIEVRS